MNRGKLDISNFPFFIINFKYIKLIKKRGKNNLNINKILDLIYPPVCGICGKINNNNLCKKCEMELKKYQNIKIIIDDEELEDKYFNELMYIFKYEGLIRKLIIDYKFNDKSYLYLTFVNFLIKNQKLFENIKKYDTIIPVPISKKRFKNRGYNQSLLVANEIAKKFNLKLMNNCLFKTKNIIEQSKLNKEEREQNIKSAFELKNKHLIQNKNILIFDDIYTTGSTVNECSKVLKLAHPKKIGVLTIAKD